MNTELVQPESSDSHARETHTVGLLHMALWFGLVTGFLELVNLGVKKYVLHDHPLLGLNTVWMSPFANATVMLVVAVPLLLAERVLSKRLIRALGVFAFSGILAGCLTLAHSAIHTLAAAGLAVGVSINITRKYLKSTEQFEQFIGRSLKWVVAAAVLNFAVVFGIQSTASTTADVPPADGPNVLLIVWDTVRAESLSTYGHERDTSTELTKIASEGVLFETAFSASPWTLPSHATLLTGRWAHELNCDWEIELDDSFPTLAEILRDRGYATAGCVANQRYCGRDFGISRGFDHWDDYNQLPIEFVLSSQVGRQVTQSRIARKIIGLRDFWGRKDADRINDEFLSWLKKPRDRSFFALLNYFDAHVPRFPPDPFSTRYAKGKVHEEIGVATHHMREGDWAEVPTPKQRGADQAAYDGCIAYLDDALKRLLAELDELGLLDDTIVIVTSDHGEHFGEHDLTNHGNSLYPQTVRVPLVMRFPKSLPSDVRVKQFVAGRDVPATILDLLGIDDVKMPGTSMARFWRTPDTQADSIYLSLRPLPRAKKWDRALRSVVIDGMQLTEFADGRIELHNLFDDPRGSVDLYEDKKSDDVVKTLKTRLDRQFQSESE